MLKQEFKNENDNLLDLKQSYLEEFNKLGIDSKYTIELARKKIEI